MGQPGLHIFHSSGVFSLRRPTSLIRRPDLPPSLKASESYGGQDGGPTVAQSYGWQADFPCPAFPSRMNKKQKAQSIRISIRPTIQKSIAVLVPFAPPRLAWDPSHGNAAYQIRTVARLGSQRLGHGRCPGLLHICHSSGVLFLRLCRSQTKASPKICVHLCCAWQVVLPPDVPPSSILDLQSSN